MNRTPISWTTFTWNPMSGCRPISEGCAFCYARTFAERKRGTPQFPHGFDLDLREKNPKKLTGPLRIKRPTMIFVNSMSDLFWDQVPEEYRHQVVDVMARCPQHTFQLLTKRPEAMRDFSLRAPFPANVWAGVTVESLRHVDRLDVLRQVQAKTRFVSIEPMLTAMPGLRLEGIHQVIVGGESGMHISKHPERALAERRGGEWVARPDRVPWVRDVRDQCRAARVAFFFKQWGGPYHGSAGDLLDGAKVQEYPANGWGDVEPSAAERDCYRLPHHRNNFP